VYDVIAVAFVLAFFGLMVLYTNACDRILGPDEQAVNEGITGTPGEPEPADEAVAA
jgi:hypothetical protein